MRAFIKRFLVDLFTGPDGETIALGRVLSIPLFLTGLVMIVHTGWSAEPPMGMADLGIGLAGVAGGALMLITGTNHIDNPLKVPKD